MVSKFGTSIEKGRPLISSDKTKHNQICLWSSWRLYINLINLVPSFVFSSYLLVSKRGRLVAGLCVMGLSTKDPPIQKALTELHKIPTFGVYGKKYWTRYSYWNSPKFVEKTRDIRTSVRQSTHFFEQQLYFKTKRGDFARGGYFRNLRVGMCRWDPGTLNLYQSYFSWILLPCTRVNSPNSPYPRVAVFQKLLRSLAQSSHVKTLYHNP